MSNNEAKLLALTGILAAFSFLGSYFKTSELALQQTAPQTTPVLAQIR